MLGVEVLTVGCNDTSFRQGIEGDRVELGEAPSERTHTFAWSCELRQGGGEREDRKAERERERERERKKERKRETDRESINQTIHVQCMTIVINMLYVHHTMTLISITQIRCTQQSHNDSVNIMKSTVALFDFISAK